MAPFLEIALTGLVAVRLHPLRSTVSIVALVAILVPYLVGIALARGLEAQAETSARLGADVHVTGVQFGRPVPLPLEAVARIRRLEGVTAVVPRIVGEVHLGKEEIPAILVGMAPNRFPAPEGCIDGALPQPGKLNEVVVGTVLADRLGLRVGSVIPPFYRNPAGERLTRVVGVFTNEAPIWQTNLILTTFETAAHVFDQPGLATDVLVWCRPNYEAIVGQRIAQEVSFAGTADRGLIRARVTTREELLALLPRSTRHREGVFSLHFVLAFAVCILVLLVTSGLGLAERRREVGILKATGWQTDEILLRGLVESLCLSVAGASVAVLLAWVWLRGLGGYGLGSFFVEGAGPGSRVPFRLVPGPALLGLLVSLVIVSSGTTWSTWRAATVPPREVMR